MPVTADATSVKATVADDGEVWVLEGVGLPRSTGLGAADFAARPPFDGPRRLRVPGGLRNADLLLRLYREVQRGSQAALEVCSPAALAGGDARPDVVLYRARGWVRPACVGGWHAFEADDAAAHGLALRAGGALPWDEVAVAELLGVHPAMPALRFVAGLDLRAAAYVLGQVIDPRWYVDPADPDGPANRLPQFLGLDPKTQAEDPPASDRARRFRAVHACWASAEAAPALLLSPGQFAWRTWYARGGGPKGELAACKRFVEFLRVTWAATVCRSGQAGRLFVPEYFFYEPAEASAYRAHAAR